MKPTMRCRSLRIWAIQPLESLRVQAQAHAARAKGPLEAPDVDITGTSIKDSMQRTLSSQAFTDRRKMRARAIYI
eukprot:scaffold180583_cov35-Tisochrysis_lutea.AAC.3